MPLIKWGPFGDIERFFEDFPSSVPKISWDLAIDLYEKDSDVIAEMSLPGIDPAKLDISVENGYLKISGSREENREDTKEEKTAKYYSKEIRRGSFERVVRMPTPVQEDKIKAEYENGILKITMPKAKEVKKKVQVQIKK